MGVLRTILAIAVVFAHTDWHGSFVFVGGRNAVQLFYVISGFLIHHVLNANPAYKDVGRFYRNRALRLYPVYYVVLGLSIFLYAFVDKAYFPRFAGLPPGVIAFLAIVAVTLIGQDWVMFLQVRDGGLHLVNGSLDYAGGLYRTMPVPQAWTLGVELSFYLIAPFVLRRPRAIFALLAASIGVRGVLVAMHLANKDPWTYRFFPAELALFLIGALMNRYALPFWRTVAQSRPWLPRTAVLVVSLVCITYFLVPLPELVRTALLFALFIPTLPLAFLFQGTSPLDKRIGDLSYPIYIGHWLVCEMMARLVPVAKVGLFANALASVVVAIAFAMFLNRCVAQPIEARRAAVRAGGERLAAAA